MTQARFDVDDYTLKVLDTVKGKHGLKNRNEALKKFAEEFGDNYVEPEVNPLVLKELDEVYNAHIKKHGHRSMTEEELDDILGL